jgi:diaminopimelate decarboxylase
MSVRTDSTAAPTRDGERDLGRASRRSSPARSPAPHLIADGRIGGVDVDELVRRFGSPLYVYDVGVFDRQVTALRAALPPLADVAFAVKANPSLAVVAHLGAHGIGADVASGGELATALRAGIDPARIVMTGPGKRDDELEAAVDAAVRAVTVESPSELARLESIAVRRRRRVPVLLRASTTAGTPTEAVRIIGDAGAGKFGMDRADLIEAARRAVASPDLDLLGVHAFGASNVRDADALVAHARSTAALAREIALKARTTVRLVDIGGGLGIPYRTEDQALDVGALGRGLARLTDGWRDDPVLTDARLLLEPGRFLLGPAGAYVTRVVDRKIVDGSTVVVLDGGIHHLLRPALVGEAHRVVAVGGAVADTSDGRLVEPVTIVGPLCTGLDVLARGVRLPRLEVGDLVAVLDVGAYGFTESMPLFLSHPMPAEVIVQSGRAALVRPRLDPGAWLDRQQLPEW